MEIKENRLTLTFEEANIIFGFSEINPAFVLKEIAMMIREKYHPDLFREFRFLMACNCSLNRYKSEDSFYIVRKMNAKYLREQFYKKEQLLISAFHYLFSIIWHFRNCRNFTDIENAGNDSLFVTKIKQQLIDAGIAVQLEISFP